MFYSEVSINMVITNDNFLPITVWLISTNVVFLKIQETQNLSSLPHTLIEIYNNLCTYTSVCVTKKTDCYKKDILQKTLHLLFYIYYFFE